MKTGLTQVALTAMLSLGMTTVAYAIDRVGSPEDETTTPAAKKKAERKGDKPSGMRSTDAPGAGKAANDAQSGSDVSTPSKMDSGAPGTPGGAAPGTSSGTEMTPKTGSGR